MARVLIVGESWVTNATHYKGFDQFTSTTFKSGVAPLKEALESGGHEVQWMTAHEAQEGFPSSVDGLAGVDVLILSRSKDSGGGEVWGQASMTVCVEVAFFSKSVSLTVERKFAGAAGDPTFDELVEPYDWEEYCNAFA